MKYMKKFSSIQNNIRSTRKNPKYGFRGYPRLNEDSQEDENNNQNNKMDNNMGNNMNNNQSNDQNNNSSINVIQFFSKLFESREMAHIYHLQDKESYKNHVVLDEYYTDVLDLIDDLIETYQGQYDVVEGYDIIDTSGTKSKNVIDYFKELTSFITNNRNIFSDKDTHLHSIIDDVLILIYKSLYKLKTFSKN
jgi:hypothetical protein